ncbi:hypothetical protein COLO4_21277 [Corchorus olitorius]|uniref:Very-long-chain aldehyde decarbonylase CER1-like C-terminal domain-containing protein n=1 Tax=Corchorus olitorius TaxID=93759 RepID=A0A1R3IUC6_9ROSI|nr:hypothetical protein COLO4_21277 [Corchorus olitorius]
MTAGYSLEASPATRWSNGTQKPIEWFIVWDEELNGNGELYIQRHPKLKTKIVDGSSLAAAIVVNSIPKETTQVLLTGKLSKVGHAIALALCQKGVQVATMNEDVYHKLKQGINTQFGNNLLHAQNYDQKMIFMQ